MQGQRNKNQIIADTVVSSECGRMSKSKLIDVSHG